MTSRELATKLRERCRKAFSDTGVTLRDRELGEQYIEVGPVFRRDPGCRFQISESVRTENYTGLPREEILWSVRVYVADTTLDIWVEEELGKVPKRVLACALEGPNW